MQLASCDYLWLVPTHDQPPCTAVNTSTCAPSLNDVSGQAVRGTTSPLTAIATPRPPGTAESDSTTLVRLVPGGNSRGSPLIVTFIVRLLRAQRRIGLARTRPRRPAAPRLRAPPR